MSNFDFIATYVDLSDSPTYTTNITLEGQLLKISFVWNERIGKRTIFIRNSADICYLQNTILHPNESFELNSNAVFDDLPYKVVLQKVGDTNKVGNIYNWSKDFILCFYRTVDIETERLNVKYGVTTPSTPILPKPFGDWILNQGFAILGYDIRYTGYKTNDIDTYDSFALSNLQDALVKSFLDPDLQQYAAFTAAVEQLIGAVDWVLDPANNQIKYYIDPNPTAPKPSDQYIWKYPSTPPKFPEAIIAYGSSAAVVCNAVLASHKAAGDPWKYDKVSLYSSLTTHVTCFVSSSKTSYNGNATAFRVANPAYNPNAEDEREEKTLPLETVAQKVISNADSSVDEVLKLLSEDYISLVANSVFDSNPSKRFVKFEDLIPQLEANKVLR